MLVRELIDLLKKQDGEAEVWVGTHCHGCFEPAESVRLDERGMVVVDTEPPT
jgi:hypothetical protein